MVSFIIPAHNEEHTVGHCLTAIREAMSGDAEPYEVIVVDDSSTDRTGEVAQSLGARAVRVEHRRISSTRNTGARLASGEVYMFVDADSRVSRGLVASARRALRTGAVGGGCAPEFEGPLPPVWRLLCPLLGWVIRLLRRPGGACQFCTREAFAAVGGFSEAHYAAEDELFVRALKRHGRFVVLAEPVLTSGRTLRTQSFWKVAWVILRCVLRGPAGFLRRDGLDVWYRPRREGPDSVVARE